MNSAIFLDRDGVIIENRPGYVRSWDDVTFLTESLNALVALRSSPYKIIIITNQSGIGRGLIQPAIADEINRRLVGAIEKAGGRIDRIYMCPHAPAENCPCRKPKPGLIYQAVQDYDIDLGSSILIGDNLSDIQAGHSAGIGRLALVRTGLGNQFADEMEISTSVQTKVFDGLAQALAGLIHLQR